MFFMEQRLARSRCYRYVFVFEHFFYSSAIAILYGHFSTVNNDYGLFNKNPVHNFEHGAIRVIFVGAYPRTYALILGPRMQRILHVV